MNKSFYTRIKGLFKEDAGGRFLGQLLLATIPRCPQIIRCISKDIKIFNPNIHKLDTEWTWPGKEKNRRADLAVIDAVTNRPLILIEIKYKDHKSQHTREQLKEYAEYCIKNKIHFIYLTQYNDVPKDDLKILNDLKIKEIGYHYLYSQLYYDLKTYAERDPSVRLLCEYLEEITPMFKKIENQEALTLLLVRSLNIAHRHGLGKIHSNSRLMYDVPDVFNNILGNISALSDEVRNKISGDYFKQTSTITFTFEPEFENKKLKNYLINDDDDNEKWIRIPSDNIKSGSMWLRSSNSINRASNDWLYLDFGFYYYLNCYDKHNPLTSHVFSSVNGKRFGKNGIYFDAKDKISKLERTKNKIFAVLNKTLESSLKVSPKEYKKDLSEIYNNLNA